MEPSKILKVGWPSTAAYVWHTRDLQSFAVLWFASCMKNLCCVTLIVASFLRTALAEDRDICSDLTYGCAKLRLPLAFTGIQKNGWLSLEKSPLTMFDGFYVCLPLK